jgi:hypothetical protein
MFFRFTNMDYCDAVSGDFNSGSGGVVFRQSDVFVYSVILILWSFGFGRSICNRYRYSLTNRRFSDPWLPSEIPDKLPSTSVRAPLCTDVKYTKSKGQLLLKENSIK